MLRSVLVAAMAASFPLSAIACATGAKCVGVGEPQFLSASLIERDETGARWLKAPEPIPPTVSLAFAVNALPLQVSPLYERGDILPRGRYSMLMNSAYHGLPPAPEGTLYFQVDLKVLLVDRTTYEIIDDVSREVAATF